jgi:hypothetical protein
MDELRLERDHALASQTLHSGPGRYRTTTTEDEGQDERRLSLRVCAATRRFAANRGGTLYETAIFEFLAAAARTSIVPANPFEGIPIGLLSTNSASACFDHRS